MRVWVAEVGGGVLVGFGGDALIDWGYGCDHDSRGTAPNVPVSVVVALW